MRCVRRTVLCREGNTYHALVTIAVPSCAMASDLFPSNWAMVITPSSLCRQTRERALWRVQSKDVARLVVVADLSSAFTNNNRLGFLTSRLVGTRATYLC